VWYCIFFFQAEDGIRDLIVTGVQTCALPISFNGDSVAHWEGDTLVVDTIAIDTRMRNYSVGKTGEASAWLHSEKEHVIERFTRTSKNYVTYQITVEDPVVLVKPFTSAPHVWTLAQDPNDVWTEYICTANEE